MTTPDTGQALLSADTESKVYVRPDEKTADVLVGTRPEYAQYRTSKGEPTLELLGALYGTREAAKLWYDHLRGTLESYGRRVSDPDRWLRSP